MKYIPVKDHSKYIYVKYKGKRKQLRKINQDTGLPGRQASDLELQLYKRERAAAASASAGSAFLNIPGFFSIIALMLFMIFLFRFIANPQSFTDQFSITQFLNNMSQLEWSSEGLQGLIGSSITADWRSFQFF